MCRINWPAPVLGLARWFTVGRSAVGTELGRNGSRFTLDGRVTFLLGASYYGGRGAPNDAVRQDLNESHTRAVLAWLADVGRIVLIHYQEPFRRGYGNWLPTAADFRAHLAGARRGGTAGWCLYNGDTRAVPGGEPRRSFDLCTRRLMEQLDGEEWAFVQGFGVN